MIVVLALKVLLVLEVRKVLKVRVEVETTKEPKV